MLHRHTIPVHGRLAHVACATGAPAPCAPPLAPAPIETPATADTKALTPLLAALGDAIAQVQARMQRSARDVAQLSVEMAVALAERLVHTEIAADRQRLDRIVLSALDRVAAPRTVVLRAHGDDLALLERQLADYPELQRYRETLTMRADDTMTRGQLKLEAEDWFVDWDTSRALDELRGVMLDEI